MRTRFRQISLLGMLFSSAIMLQGCAALAWVGIVSADVALSSDVKFESFERSWVAPPEERHAAHLEQLAVAPFAGNTRVAEWWATVLSQATDRHVISPAEV